MDASTTIPSPSISPVNVIMFKVIPNILIAKRVTIMDNGIEMPIIIVDLKLCKKTHKITIDKIKPCNKDSTRILIVSRIDSVSSEMISKVMSDGSVSCNWSIFL